MNKSNKVVLLTGATQGIGFTTSECLVKNGYRVFGTYRNTSNIKAIEQLTALYPALFTPIELDVTDSVSIGNAIQIMVDEVERIDVLINNACHVVVGTVESCSLDQQLRSMDVNYFGVVRMLQAVLPIMRKQREGQVINMSSVAGIDPYPPIETYTATKFALEGLTESLVTTLSPWNIKCSLIEPGGVKTYAPETAEQGDRKLDGRSYQEYSKEAQKLMIQSYEQGALEPSEISEIILGIIQNDKPYLRYQVGAFAEQIGRKRFHDPTGSESVVDKKQMLIEMGLYDLLTS